MPGGTPSPSVAVEIDDIKASMFLDIGEDGRITPMRVRDTLLRG